MSRPIVYLDLDRTLFQTTRIVEIWQWLERRYPEIVDAERDLARMKQFYQWYDDLYCYDMSAHVRALGLVPGQVYRELATSELADGRFEFPGCSALIDYLKTVALPIILTYGTDDYQRCKVALCPSLAGVPVETTLSAKRDWLAQHAAAGWLIDDKPIGDGLPTSVRFIQVDLEEKPAVKSNPHWPVVTTLHQVEEYLRHELH